MAKDAKTGLTAKQEKFCQVYMQTGNASEAYRQSYDVSKSTEKSVNELASHLLANVKIISRVNELKQLAAKRNEITVDTITNMLKEAYFLAQTKEETAQITNAANSLAKLHGLIIDKAETKNTVVMMPSIKLGEDELNFDIGN
jgi:phage terminase small subunit